MRIFIGGSRDLNLSQKVRQRIEGITKKGFHILVGDAAGIDSEVQAFLYSIGYKKVTVYHAGNFCRSNIGKWPAKSISSTNTGFDFYADKDRAMGKDKELSWCQSVGLFIKYYVPNQQLILKKKGGKSYEYFYRRFQGS